MKNPYIIAEIASAHEGVLPKLKKLITKSYESGADAVKLQIFQRDKLLSKNHNLYKEFGEIELSRSEWTEAIIYASKYKIDLIIEPYDYESLLFAEQFDEVFAYKVPTASIEDDSIIKILIDSKKMLFAGVGGAMLNEIESFISHLPKDSLTLLCGFQNFPTKVYDSKLYQISFLRDKMNCRIGYADHIDADDYEMSRLVACLAISQGAEVIEKHITDNRLLKGRDYYSSLNPDEFKSFVQLVKSIPKIIGENDNWVLSDAELKYRRFSKKFAVLENDIKIGEKLKKDYLKFKRTNNLGISENEIINFYGKSINKSKLSGQELLKSDFNEE